MSDPRLDDAERQRLVDVLMDARRAVAAAKRVYDEDAERQARAAVDVAKHALGERGDPWWDDGAPDLNRRMVRNTVYTGWSAALGLD